MANVFALSPNIAGSRTASPTTHAIVPNKLLGIALQTLIPLGLMVLPFIENVNKFSNPFRRPIAMSVFLFGTFLTIYLGIGACLPIDKSLTLGLF